MAIKVYIASITGNTEIKKRIQRMLMILDTTIVDYEVVDITQPGCEKEREYMRTHSQPRDGDTVPLPPQIFNDDEYCGDYDAFDSANEDNKLKVFLKVQPEEPESSDVAGGTVENGVAENGDATQAEEKDEGAAGSEDAESEVKPDEDAVPDETDEKTGQEGEPKDAEDEAGEPEADEGEEGEEGEPEADEGEEGVEGQAAGDEEGEPEADEGEEGEEGQAAGDEADADEEGEGAADEEDAVGEEDEVPEEDVEEEGDVEEDVPEESDKDAEKGQCSIFSEPFPEAPSASFPFSADNNSQMLTDLYPGKPFLENF